MNYYHIFIYLFIYIFNTFFMFNRKITLIFDNQKFRILNISMKILQDLSLLSILFLFYNAELLKICNSTQVRVSSLAFVDDVNLLVYESITEKNCKQLKAVHDKYLF